MDEYLRKVSFKRSEVDDNIYIKKFGNKMVVIILYVDDLIITENSEKLISQVKVELKNGFKMTDLRILHYYLGIKV